MTGETAGARSLAGERGRRPGSASRIPAGAGRVRARSVPDAQRGLVVLGAVPRASAGRAPKTAAATAAVTRPSPCRVRAPSGLLGGQRQHEPRERPGAGGPASQQHRHEAYAEHGQRREAEHRRRVEDDVAGVGSPSPAVRAAATRRGPPRRAAAVRARGGRAPARRGTDRRRVVAARVAVTSVAVSRTAVASTVSTSAHGDGRTPAGARRRSRSPRWVRRECRRTQRARRSRRRRARAARLGGRGAELLAAARAPSPRAGPARPRGRTATSRPARSAAARDRAVPRSRTTSTVERCSPAGRGGARACGAGRRPAG